MKPSDIVRLRRHVLRPWWLTTWIVFAALGFSASAQAPGDVRVALVIGNSAYADAPLSNPANDARAMASLLRGLGFTVVEVRDGERDQMLQSLAIVRELLQGKRGVGMLYYAGHGLQLDWHNYMVPVSARMAKASDVPVQAVDVNAVLDAFKSAGNRLNILVLDACRDNPFEGTASGKGLAQLDAPTGTFLAYATAPGNVASDGDSVSGNGLYTQFLLQELKQPTARIEDVFKRVRLQVRQKSGGRQIPWESTSLEDDFYFNTGRLVAQPKLEERLKAQEDPQQKAAWEKVQNSRNADDFYAFLLAYPNGPFSELAQANVQRLQKAQVVAVPDKHGFGQVEGGVRFRVGDSTEWDVLNAFRGDLKIGTLRETVVHVGADRVQTSLGGVYTLEGWSMVNRNNSSYSPPLQTVPAGGFMVGKTWQFRTKHSVPGWPDVDTLGISTVVALEDVTVPAGTFKAFRVETVLSNRWVRWTFTEWREPDWGMPIKRTYKLLTPGGQGIPNQLDTLVMRSRQRGPG